MDAAYYLRDSLIDPTGDAFPKERILATGFLNLNYSAGDFSAGLRYENYQNQRIGLPEGYIGEGITYRYARFARDNYDITVGNFYDQFGSGLTLRTYQEPNLGIDNNLDGIRIAYSPTLGVNLKALVGRQRVFFEKSNSVIRGLDGELNFGQTFDWEGQTNFILGGSLVSKYEEANDPTINLPDNVAVGAVRTNLITGDFNIFGEFGLKANDPNALNNYIYKNGSAIYISATYGKNNLSASAGYKRYDNFDLRSQREIPEITQLTLNFLPSLTTVHTYALPALYSFATQPNGETGIMLELAYNFKRKTPIGGKYGMKATVSFTNSYSLDKDYELRDVYSPIDTTVIGESFEGSEGYTSSFGIGPYQYFQDFHVEIKKKLNKKVKTTFSYFNFIYNSSALLKGVNDYELESNNLEPEIVKVNAAVLEVLWKIKKSHSLRGEFQTLLTQQDRGDWAMILLEYSVAPNWFFAVQDAYNYGNPVEELRVHYYSFNFGYTLGTSRLAMGYGRQQEGVFCVGGICRTVPASNGFSVSLTSNF